MKAIILAAGYGNRMRPLTDHNHKTLLSIAGKTIISRIIEGLLSNNVNSIVLVTGYRESDLRTYVLNNFPKVNFQFVENVRYRETNNIFSLALAFDSIKFDQDILVIESDLVFDSSIISRIINSPYKNVALVDHYKSGMDGTVVALSGDVITNVIPPHLQGEDFNFTDKFKTLNIYKFSKEFCKFRFKRLLNYYAKVIDDNCYYELILGILIYMQQEIIYAEIVSNEVWAEVDDVNDLRVAEFVFNKANQKKILEDAWGGYWNYDIIDYCFIRNMYFPNNAIIAEVKNNLSHLLHNYGSKNTIVNNKLSHLLLFKEERLIALNGAAQLYPFLRSKFKGKTTLIPSPTFGEYERIFSETIYYKDRPGINWREIEEKCELCDSIVIVNPNNPTGTVLNPDFIIDLAKRYPNKSFIIDESFIAFSDELSVISILENDPIDNILVLTSMSKSYGFPGLRLGYCYSSNAMLINEIKEWLPIWNFNSFAEFILEIVLKHRTDFAASITKTKNDTIVFCKNLKRLEKIKEVYPTGANFILISLDKFNEDQMIEWFLNSYNTLLKSVTSKFNDNKSYFRIAVRTTTENLNLVKQLEEYFNA